MIFPIPTQARRFHKNPTLTEILCHIQCRSAGISFLGIQKGFGIMADVALFHAPSGTTLACPVSELSVKRIREIISESNKKFGIEVDEASL
jgi:hypothetical protein